ncbi:glycosyltransferase family 61 protein [Roseovarius sp. S1116L3]|uniref:glycosyltransferase family 61 protein n=1 Tax=Roseovarius roseus TaxID=3342636 RepID=UPI0037279B6D
MRRKIKRKVAEALFRWACRRPTGRLGSSILEAFGMRSVRVANFSDVAAPFATVAGQSTSRVEAPRWNEGEPRVRTGDFPPIRARIVQQPVFTISSSAFLQDDLLYLPNPVLSDRGRTATADENLFHLSKNTAVGAISAEDEVDSGIFIGGAGSSNWYHFVIECLPKAYLAQRLPSEFDHLPLLVPEECRRIPSFADALALFSGKREVRFLKYNARNFANELVVFDDVSIGPFNMAPGEWPSIDDYAQHDAELQSFIEAFRSNLFADKRPAAAERRIFLQRPPQQRAYNQDEIRAIAERYGFEPVSPETLSLREQAELFASASSVIGASGAAWVGMIFRECPMKALSWLPSEYSEFCSYSSLARLLGHQLDFIEAKPDKKLQTTGDAFVTGYTVCPAEFEAATQRLVRSLEA